MGSIVDTFKKYNAATMNNDFALLRVNAQILVGKDKYNNQVVVIESTEINRDSIAQRTRELSFECNKKIVYVEEGVFIEKTVHILRCYSALQKDRMMFLKLCDTFFLGKDVYIDTIVEFFGIMGNFFSAEAKMSETALIGLYGELFTIYFYAHEYDFARGWQNQDKMKFDFSINAKTKLEIKSTCKQTRIHHFKHEQLATNIVDIYILSYKFRLDNDGLSLEELINRTIPLLNKYPKKQARLLKVLYLYEGKNYLKELKFHEEFTKENMRFFNASDVPRFAEETPANVSEAEYDSNCENVLFIDGKEIINRFIKLTNEE